MSYQQASACDTLHGTRSAPELSEQRAFIFWDWLRQQYNEIKNVMKRRRYSYFSKWSPVLVRLYGGGRGPGGSRSNSLTSVIETQEENAIRIE